MEIVVGPESSVAMGWVGDSIPSGAEGISTSTRSVNP